MRVFFFQFLDDLNSQEQILRYSNVWFWLYFLQVFVNGVQKLREAALLSALLFTTDGTCCDGEDCVNFAVQVGKAETCWSAVLELSDAALSIKKYGKSDSLNFEARFLQWSEPENLKSFLPRPATSTIPGYCCWSRLNTDRGSLVGKLSLVRFLVNKLSCRNCTASAVDGISSYSLISLLSELRSSFIIRCAALRFASFSLWSYARVSSELARQITSNFPSEENIIVWSRS